MRLLAIIIAIVFVVFDLTNATNYYGGDFMSSYTGQEPNYGPFPIGSGFPVTGYSQVGPYLPQPPAPSQPQAQMPPPPSVGPVSKPYSSYSPAFGQFITPFGPILPASYQSQHPVFIPTHIDNNGRRHIRVGEHSFVQEMDTDSTASGTGTGTGTGSGYGYYGYYGYGGGYPSIRPTTPAPTTPPTPTTLAPTTVVTTTPLSIAPTTTLGLGIAPTTSPMLGNTPPTPLPTTPSPELPTTTLSTGGVQKLSYYRYDGGYGKYGGYDNFYSDNNYGNRGSGKLNIDVNANNELVFNDGTQQPTQTTTQATTTLPTGTNAPTTTGKGATRYLNRKKTSKFHFKITPDNLLNVITL